jgi:hypothetical protein
MDLDDYIPSTHNAFLLVTPSGNSMSALERLSVFVLMMRLKRSPTRHSARAGQSAKPSPLGCGSISGGERVTATLARLWWDWLVVFRLGLGATALRSCRTTARTILTATRNLELVRLYKKFLPTELTGPIHEHRTSRFEALLRAIGLPRVCIFSFWNLSATNRTTSDLSCGSVMFSHAACVTSQVNWLEPRWC